ncbi:hypothetical protein FNJ47_48695, partial [Bradyrhizobium sp. UFLA 03-164]|nr:hypothetical protein [Bradyrhizobium uaiense]
RQRFLRHHGRQMLALGDGAVGDAAAMDVEAGAQMRILDQRAQLAGMKRRAVLVDVAIDQGGCFETSKATTHQAPPDLVDEV